MRADKRNSLRKALGLASCRVAPAAFLTLAMSVASAALTTVKPSQSFAQWQIDVGAPDGRVYLSGQSYEGYYRAYQCEHFFLAQAVVAAIPHAGVQVDSQAQARAMATTLQQYQCEPAQGEYRILDLGGEVEIDHGSEAVEYWSALQAVTEAGLEVGLVFDASPYAIVD